MVVSIIRTVGKRARSLVDTATRWASRNRTYLGIGLVGLLLYNLATRRGFPLSLSKRRFRAKVGDPVLDSSRTVDVPIVN